MPKTANPNPDVLVLGGHPCTYVAAALLRSKAPALRVLHATLPHELHPDRLVLINADLFSLDPLLAPLQRKLKLIPIYGLRFLADDADVSSEYRNKSILGYISTYADVRAAAMALATEMGVEQITPKEVEILRLDETGFDIALGKTALHPKVLLLGGHLSPPQQKLLGMPDSWGEGILHRHTFTLIKSPGVGDGSHRPTLPMSLDLQGTLSWGWMLHTQAQAQISVSQPVESIAQQPPGKLLQHWANVLHAHAVLKDPVPIESASTASIDLPLAGALAHEGVANRTLLIGPAGGFYSACSEDIYPNCWSSIYAVDILRRALKERHLQDALNAYRFSWRTTLGDYLRGPQQNLRFLLPLVYRNQVMTARLSESILKGKSVVR